VVYYRPAGDLNAIQGVLDVFGFEVVLKKVQHNYNIVPLFRVLEEPLSTTLAAGTAPSMRHCSASSMHAFR
jgi:hypothetical protein